MTNQQPPLGPSRMGPKRVGLICALLTAIGPISMSLYLPAINQVSAAFDTTTLMVKLTLILYFLGFAVAQLIIGPISDVYGRKSTSIFSLVCFLLASIGAIYAPNIETLIVARILQGVGASGGMAIARAIVRDCYVGRSAVHIMNLISMILAVVPALSPVIGGAITDLFGWRTIFLAVFAYGVVTLAVVIFLFRETASGSSKKFSFSSLVISYKTILKSPHFLFSTLVLVGSIGGVYAEYTFLPFILMAQVGMTPTEFGIGILLQSVGFLCGVFILQIMLNRFDTHLLVRIGIASILLGNAGMSLLIFVQPTYILVMGSVAVHSFGVAFILPTITTSALAPFDRNAGAAAAIMGFMQMSAGLVCGSIGAMIENPAVALGILMPMIGLLALYGNIKRLKYGPS